MAPKSLRKAKLKICGSLPKPGINSPARDISAVSSILYPSLSATVSKPDSRASSAKKAAAVLGIEHYVLDLRNEFQEEIIKYFHSEYDRGRTPNPCVKCNQVVKYKRFLEEADRLGAHYISSGQYAKIVLEDGKLRFSKRVPIMVR